MADFYLKEGDTSPSIKLLLQRADGTKPDLTGATVLFHMRDAATGTVKVNSGVMSVNGSASDHDSVQYDWVAGDVDTAGDYEAEVEVTLSSGKVETFPNAGYKSIKIMKDIV